MHYDWREVVKTAESSYAENELGEFIYGFVRSVKPELCVELGVLHGYSTLHIAAALRDNKTGYLYSYDRWPAHIPNCEMDVRRRITSVGMDDLVHLETRDVFRNPPMFSNPIDFLYVDLGNTYNTLSWAFNKYGLHMSDSGTMMFEGGTFERDQLEWVARHDRNGGLRPFLKSLSGAYNWFVIKKFPGITIVQLNE